MRNLLASLSGGSGIGAAAAVGVIVVAAGAWVQFGRSQEDAPVVTAALPQSDAPQVAVDPAPEPTTEATEPVIHTALEPPTFDEVRREADGMTVIAGTASPGASVLILRDGLEIAKATADGSGKFATLTMISPDGQGHVLTLLQMADGQEVASIDKILLAPLAAPVVVAEAPVDDVVAEAPADDAGAETLPQEETLPEVVAEVENETAVAPDDAAASETEMEVASTQEATQQAAAIEEPSPTDTNTEAAVETVTAALADPKQDETDLAVKTPAETVSQAVETDIETGVAEVPQEPVETTQTAALDVAVKPEVTSIQPEAETPPAVDDAPAQQVAVLKSTEDGVELLNPVAPEVMDNVAIDTISYSDAGAVQLAGRAQSVAQSVRVYLDNDTVVSLPVDKDGRWRGDLPNVDEGIYTLRVDEVAADGSVTSRVETPFKREDPEVLAAASAGAQGPIKAITVQKGATLWAIARDRYGRGDLYVRVFEANRSSIRDPDLIYPGQIFDLPE